MCYCYTAVVYKQIPVPKPGPDEVLINVKYSGVCHTDLHAVMGDWPLPVKMPLIGGHEGSGVVVGRGELVKDVEVGDHAGIKVRQDTHMYLSFVFFFYCFIVFFIINTTPDLTLPFEFFPHPHSGSTAPA